MEEVKYHHQQIFDELRKFNQDMDKYRRINFWLDWGYFWILHLLIWLNFALLWLVMLK